MSDSDIPEEVSTFKKKYITVQAKRLCNYISFLDLFLFQCISTSFFVCEVFVQFERKSKAYH